MNPVIIYKSLDSIFSVLKNEKIIESSEVQELLSIYEKKKCREEKEIVNSLIVFEGLDGSGKSTILKIIDKLTICKKYSTPPECVKHLRPYFDKECAELRSAFYSLGNYIAAEEIKHLLSEATVLLDRFWHSTCASALANEAGCIQNLPPASSDIYCWPTDLLKPDAVIFLTVTEEQRIQRLSRRVNYSSEENRLEIDDDFRNAFIAAFKMIREPSITEVKSIKPPKVVAQQVLSLLTSMGLNIK